MSVIVLGMEMPECCLRCCFFAGNGCKVTQTIFPDWMNIASKPQGCPIRPLPEKHGRLIDADALPRYTGYALSADEVATAVENAPTIVEAEGDN